MNLSNETVGQDFADMLRDSAERLGINLEQAPEAIRRYSAESLLRLSASVGQAGHREALQAETMNVALFSAGVAVDSGDLADRELVGNIAGGLAIGARLLAGA